MFRTHQGATIDRLGVCFFFILILFLTTSQALGVVSKLHPNIEYISVVTLSKPSRGLWEAQADLSVDRPALAPV